MNDQQINCPYTECVMPFKSLLSLCHHWTKTHGNNGTESLYVKLNGLQQPMTCKCGCGHKTKYLDIGRGYSEYCKGHAARVHNNWGHNPKVVEKNKVAMTEGRKSGKIKTWNKGLSADTDERVKANAQGCKQFYENNPERVEFYSQKMKQQWEDGIIKPLYGEDSSQWKGGISPLQHSARSNKKLYQEWIYPKLINSGFKCSRCSNNKDLHVHHDKETFSEIINKIAKENNWELASTVDLINPNQELLELKNKIIELVSDYHIEKNISGIVLCKACHKKEHASLNF